MATHSGQPRLRFDSPYSEVVSELARFEASLAPFVVSNDVVSIREWRSTDTDLVEEAFADELIPLISTVPSPFSRSAGEEFIIRQGPRLTSGEGWSMVIVHNDSGRAVGQIGLWISRLVKGRAELGYWVAESARGKGLAREALRLVSDWAFAELPLARLSLFIEEWNVASIRTATAAGFQREALLRNWELIDGEPRDMWSFVRLRDS